MHAVAPSAGIAADGGAGGGAPLVCGGLGAYERERVLEIASALGGGLWPAHEDGRSILLLDREPIRWEGDRERGWGWIEGDLWCGRASTWQRAATLGACGLVAAGRRRFIHSSVSGLAPVYWIEDERATYFASSIDALVGASRRPLSVDWDAWAAITVLRYPLGERTPFAEISRLGSFSTLRRRRGRARVERPTWPWTEVDPDLSIAAAAEAVTIALRGSLGRLEGEVLCPLSGGQDSRMLLCALGERERVSTTAITVSDDEGGSLEEDLAVPVAAALGVAHERIEAAAADYPRDWAERARRVEYQFVDHAWLVPLARRIGGNPAPTLDGYGLDTILAAGVRFYSLATIESSSPRDANLALFENLRQYGHAEQVLEERFAGPLVARARDQFVAATEPFEGHPSQVILSFYATRSLRGVSTYPSGLLGREARVIAPGASDPVVTAALSVSPLRKRGGHIYSAIFERLAPAVGRLPSTGDTARGRPHLPRRWRSDPAIEAYRTLLTDGPLASHVGPELRSWLHRPERGELSGDTRMGLEAIAMFHAWWRRYRGDLREVDATELTSA